MGISLTSETRHGDAEASYYVTERADVVRNGRKIALVLYTDGVCEGLHNAAGNYIGGDLAGWDPASGTDAQKIADAWAADGWKVA